MTENINKSTPLMIRCSANGRIQHLKDWQSVKTTTNGNRYLNFSFHTSKKNKDGNYENAYQDCLVWGNMCDEVTRLAGTNKMVTITGKLESFVKEQLRLDTGNKLITQEDGTYAKEKVHKNIKLIVSSIEPYQFISTERKQDDTVREESQFDDHIPF